MAYNSTSWTKDALTKAGISVSTTGDTNINGALTANTLQLSDNVIKASDGGSTITLETNDNVTIAGDLTVTGGKIIFGNAEQMNNETDELVAFVASGDDRMLISAQSGGVGEDSGFLLYEGSNIRWSIQQDASDNSDYPLVWDYATPTAGGATKLKLTSSGDLSCAGKFACNGQTPAAAPDYTISNVSIDRNMDADSLGIGELADIVGTLISDLQSVGILQ